MTDQDQAELLAWRLAFDHLGDGTPDGAAQAINTEMDRLKRDSDHYKEMSALTERLSQRLAIDWSRLARIGREAEEVSRGHDEPQ